MAQASLDKLAGALCVEAVSDDALLRRLKSSGYSAVYFNDLFAKLSPAGSSPSIRETLPPGDEPLLVFRPLEEAVSLRRRLEAFGLLLKSSHFMETLPPLGQGPEWIYPVHERHLETAAAAGLAFVTTHLGSISAMPKFQDDVSGGDYALRLCARARSLYGEREIYEDSLLVYRRLCAEAARKGLRVTIETGCIELPAVSGDIAKLLAFIEEVGAPNLGICLDAGHCHLRGLSLPAALRACGSLLWELHVHDNSGSSDEHAPLGSGNVAWRVFVDALREASYSGFVVFEQSSYEANAAYWLSLTR